MIDTSLWILVSIGLKETSVALAHGSAYTAPDRECIYQNSDFSTLTDVLLRYERDQGIKLHGARCGISMPGATYGESLTVARARWTVSRTGLSALFGTAAEIVNEVAAKAWALVDAPGRLVSLRSERDPDFRRAGRWAVISIDAGVGTALIAADEAGRVSVAEGEAGHGGFAPASDVERKLHAALAEREAHVSWEHVLTLGEEDPLWERLDRRLSREERQNLIMRCAGAFVGDVVLSHGSWDGAIVTGCRTTELKKNMGIALYNDAFENKHLRRRLKVTPRWLLDRANAPLAGVATMMRHRITVAPNAQDRTPGSNPWSRHAA